MQLKAWTGATVSRSGDGREDLLAHVAYWDAFFAERLARGLARSSGLAKDVNGQTANLLTKLSSGLADAVG